MARRITIVGAGPGGYTAAFEAAKKGAVVTLVENRWLGGTCLNCGCIPTKTLKSSAETLESISRAAEFGLAGTGRFVADMPAVRERKRKVSATLCGGLEKTCAKLKVRLVMGKGEVVSASLVRVHKADGVIEDIAGDRVILATGSGPLSLPALPVDGTHILISDDALELDYVPKRLIVVGGGIVGCELAFIFRTFGSEVTVVEGQNRLLPVPSVDEEISKLIQREMKKNGIRVELCRTTQSAQVTDGVVRAELGPSPFVSPLPESAKSELALEADALFVTVGRVPHSNGLGLEAAGVAMDKRGYVLADEYFETNVPGIFAIGDILGPQRIMLAHVAATEGLVAAHNCLGAREKVEYGVVPSGIFVSPEVGCVGLTEAQAKDAGYRVSVSQFQFRELGKAQAMGELPGFFKLVADADGGRLLGAHIAGAHATDLIAEAALALNMGATVADIASTIHAHPTLAEGVYEAARAIMERGDAAKS